MDKSVAPFDTVTVFGGASIDRIARSDGPLVMGASNPGTVKRLPGGVGLNLATILARLGLNVRLVGRVGSDPDGDAIITAAKGAGIDVRALSVSPGRPTASYYATFDADGNLAVGIADMTICEEITPALIADTAAGQHQSDLWVVDANLPGETLAYLAAEARAARRPIAALTVSPVKAERLVPLLDQLTYLFANRREAAVLTGHDPDEAGTTPGAPRRRTRAAPPDQGRGHQRDRTAGRCERRRHPLLRRAANDGEDGQRLRRFTRCRYDRGLARGRSLGDAVRWGLAAAAMTLESGGVALARFTPTSLTERIGHPRYAGDGVSRAPLAISDEISAALPIR